MARKNAALEEVGMHHSSFQDMKLGLTYDDVLLVPRRSVVFSRSEIDTSTLLTKSISLKIPVVSANMDTVTESDMAIAMAELGGIGIIHRFFPVDEQVREVRRVKRFKGRIIENPVTVSPDDCMGDALELMAQHRISGLLVVSNGMKLEGILTSRDVRLETDRSVHIAELMTTRENLITAPANTTPEEAREIFRKEKVEKLPLVDDDGILKGLIALKDISKVTGDSPSTIDKKGRLRVGAAIGVKPGFIDRAKALLDADCDALVVDIAHGHSDFAINTIKQVRRELGDVQLIAGNVATAEGTEDLIAAGVDAVKVGVGPGSTCTTRIVTGSGVPQLTAIRDCIEAALDSSIPIIADGGIRTSGDITKALAAGASTVMLGNLLAGTDESPGLPLTRDGRKFKVYRGMASQYAAMDRKEREGEKLVDGVIQAVVPEGVGAVVPYRGSVKEIVGQLVGGMRSGISYCGGRSIPGMQKNARFLRITGAGIKESHPHDVQRI